MKNWHKILLAVVLLAGGGFAVYWFCFKKKTLKATSTVAAAVGYEYADGSFLKNGFYYNKSNAVIGLVSADGKNINTTDGTSFLGYVDAGPDGLPSDGQIEDNS